MANLLNCSTLLVSEIVSRDLHVAVDVQLDDIGPHALLFKSQLCTLNLIGQ